MSSFKESHSSRPHSQHRTSMTSATSSNIPIRNSTSRTHSHSMSLGSMHPTHRVSRRKSMTSSAINNAAAIAAAIDGANEQYTDSAHANRRSLPLKTGSNRGTNESAIVSGSGALVDGPEAEFMDFTRNSNLAANFENGHDGSAIADGLLLPNRGGTSSKARNRRASEGAPHSKSEGKRASGELRCEKCGKGYKHSSCLTKHLWEHTPEWSYTSKLLISKHQQVQLLEAASVLVGMNQDVPDTTESVKVHDSDHSSASPAASGVSDPHEDYLSSAETTPPPNSEQTYAQDSFSTIREKRHSASSSVFSRSYQSTASMPAGSIPLNGNDFGQYHYSSNQRRPSSSGLGAPRSFNVDDEEAGLAAAVESLCSFGTPRSGAVHLPPDIPPVPPLPARFANANKLSDTAVHSAMAPSIIDLPPPSYQRISNERDVLMKTRRKSSNAVEDDDSDEHPVSRGRNDEDDDEMMFGRDEAIF